MNPLVNTDVCDALSASLGEAKTIPQDHTMIEIKIVYYRLERRKLIYNYRVVEVTLPDTRGRYYTVTGPGLHIRAVGNLFYAARYIADAINGKLKEKA